MTKADLVEEIAKDTGLSKKDTSVVVNMIIENICKALAEGDKVELRGFGSFKVKSRNPRKARNPSTASTNRVSPSATSTGGSTPRPIGTT